MIKRKIELNEAAGRADAFLLITILFIVGFAIVSLTTNPTYTGVSIGDKAPELSGDIYNGTNWQQVTINDMFNDSWQEGDFGGTWVMVEFMDINCGHCQKAAPEVGSYSDSWMNDATLANGAKIEFVAVSIQLGLGGDEYTRENIEGFRTEYSHNIPYMDDLDNDLKGSWKIPGTPTYFLVAPNGLISYSTPESFGVSVWEHMAQTIPLDQGGE
ncbi:MAG: hypothetical protein CXT71_04725 [Methanobacteriota archaeon]|jgi:thiol-disulfide isomerase/thioredoxin|nr:MAG: hypothetical protein CXT71_04725 [Euryarchaeota archaeon]